MKFPDIVFKGTNVAVSDKLKTLVEQKFSTLANFVGDESDVRCEVEFEKESSHNSGQIYRVEVNLWLAGDLYRADVTKETFEAAIDVVRDELDRDLSKKHDKRQTLKRKGGREIKEVVRFGEEE